MEATTRQTLCKDNTPLMLLHTAPTGGKPEGAKKAPLAACAVVSIQTDHAALLELHVHTDHRKKGLGDAMMRWVTWQPKGTLVLAC